MRGLSGARPHGCCSHVIGFSLFFLCCIFPRPSIVFNYEVDGGGDCESKFGDSDLKVVDIAFNGAV